MDKSKLIQKLSTKLSTYPQVGCDGSMPQNSVVFVHATLRGDFVKNDEVLEGGNPYLAFEPYVCQIPLADGGYSTVCLQGPGLEKTRIFVQTGHEKELEGLLNLAYREGVTSYQEIYNRLTDKIKAYEGTLRMVKEELVMGGDWETAKRQIEKVL